MKQILIISNQDGVHETFRRTLGDQYQMEVAAKFEEGLALLQRQRYDLNFLDLDLLDPDGGEKNGVLAQRGLQRLWHIQPRARVVVMAPRAKVRDAVAAVKSGAENYLVHPIEASVLALVTQRVHTQLRREAELEYLRDQFWKKESLELVTTASPVMRKVFRNVKAVAPTRSTVLLTGETGVGKGVVAKLIHLHSTRANGPFVAVHCGAIPENLIESDLFGHEQGAFTSAVKKKLGKFELAHGGTIFLDEIGTIAPSIQVKLLQVLQEAKFQRVGGEEEIRSDIRIIAATNEDLMDLCEQGAFRKDLFYRLNVFPIEVPPLRDRPEDIPYLAELFLKNMNGYYGKTIQGIRREVLDALQKYDWPGNIRELENLIERSYILEETPLLSLAGFPAEIYGGYRSETQDPIDVGIPLAEARQRMVASFENRYLKELLALKMGKINDSAEAAGIGVRQLHKLMKKYGLDKDDYKAPPGQEPVSESQT